jgi:hypothetical protein
VAEVKANRLLGGCTGATSLETNWPQNRCQLVRKRPRSGARFPHMRNTSTLVVAAGVLLLSAGGAIAVRTARMASNQRPAVSTPTKVQQGAATQLEFRELLDPGPALRPSAKAASLDGKRVHIVGFMAEMEERIEGAFYLVPRPIKLDESGARRRGSRLCAGRREYLLLLAQRWKLLSGPLHAYHLLGPTQPEHGTAVCKNHKATLTPGYCAHNANPKITNADSLVSQATLSGSDPSGMGRWCNHVFADGSWDFTFAGANTNPCGTTSVLPVRAGLYSRAGANSV